MQFFLGHIIPALSCTVLLVAALASFFLGVLGLPLNCLLLICICGFTQELEFWWCCERSVVSELNLRFRVLQGGSAVILVCRSDSRIHMANQKICGGMYVSWLCLSVCLCTTHALNFAYIHMQIITWFCVFLFFTCKWIIEDFDLKLLFVLSSHARLLIDTWMRCVVFFFLMYVDWFRHTWQGSSSMLKEDRQTSTKTHQW